MEGKEWSVEKEALLGTDVLLCLCHVTCGTTTHVVAAAGCKCRVRGGKPCLPCFHYRSLISWPSHDLPESSPAPLHTTNTSYSRAPFLYLIPACGGD